MENYEDESNETKRNNSLLSGCNMLVIMDFDVLIRKRKSRNNKDYKVEECLSSQKSNKLEHPVRFLSSTLSPPPSESTMKTQPCRNTNLNKPTNSQKQKMKCSRRYYFSRVTLLCLALVQLLCVTDFIECKNLNNYRNSIRSSGISSDSRNKIGRNYINSNKNGVGGNNVTENDNFEPKSLSHRRHHHHRRHHQGHDNNVQSIQPKICHSLASSNSYLSTAFAHNFASQQRSNELSMENKLVLSPIVFQGICFIPRLFKSLFI